MICCDTSTVAKLYVAELESRAVRLRLEAEDQVCVSDLVRVELMGVFHRRLREGKWTQADFNTAMRQFANDEIGGFWTWLPLDGRVVELAAKSFATLPAGVFLRASDCLHLVTALQHGFSEIHTHDRHQAAAASALGLVPVAISP
ncbi:hypothetical protein ASA1KI_42510 [Opitutales bacterium ASA1]|uniref:type II toxin-antitoxin system VapC family toxin n=1 Tax=Congregicoccus parvus TaxID=3081749 RepID=UPI002B2CAC60|nr:hypothetical protein ASA1KI_42510 [Opitutales bacterium ASA1]